MPAFLRIVALADTHLRHGGLVIPEGDVLVHAGDMLQHGSLDELARAADFFRALPHQDRHAPKFRVWAFGATRRV